MASEIKVAGGGIFGLACAWELTRRGRKVRLFEADRIGAGASGGHVGALAPHAPENWNDKKQVQLDALVAATDWWAEVGAAGGVDPGYARTGRIQPVAPGAEARMAERIRAARAHWPQWAGMELTERPQAALVPVSPSGLWLVDRLTARISPRRAGAALAAAIRAQGGEIVEGQAAPDAPAIWATGAAGLAPFGGNGVKGQSALLALDMADAPQVFADGIHVIPHADGTVAIGSTTERDGDLTAATNITLSLALWDWCAAHAVPLIYASSAATYGDGAAGFDDDASPAALAQLRPLNLYGWSKHAFDRRIADLIARGRPRPPHWAGLKFFNVYGPNEYHKGHMISVVKRKADEIAAGQPATLFRSHRDDIPDGYQARDFIWVGDCVDVVLWLLNNPQVAGLFNVGTGTARTYVDLVRAVFAAMNRTPEISFIDTPDHLRAQYQYFTQARMERLREAGYDRPFTALEDGVATYVRDHLLAADPYR